MINLTLWNQKVFEFGVEVGGIFELSPPPIGWGAFEFPLGFTCPGAAFCGNPDPCAVIKKIQIPVPGLSITLPSLSMAIPSFKIKFAFPPSVIIPIACPEYPDKENREDEVPEVNPIPSLGGDKYGFIVQFP